MQLSISHLTKHKIETVPTSLFRGAIKQELSGSVPADFNQIFQYFLDKVDANSDLEIDIYEYSEYTSNQTILDLFKSAQSEYLISQKQPETILNSPQTVDGKKYISNPFLMLIRRSLHYRKCPIRPRSRTL
jgi:hypothetical protein